MFNVLKNAALFTIAYVAIVHVVFWCVLFLSITIQLFWKAFAFFFLVMLAFLTFDYVKAQGGLKQLTSNWKIPSFTS